MAKSDYEAEVKLTGDAKGAKKAIAETESGFKKLTSSFKKSVAQQAAAFAGGVLAIGGFVKAIKSSIAAAVEQEDAIKRLETATAKLGDIGAQTAQSVQKFSSELQKVSTVGDEAAISTGAFLLQMGVAPGQINQAIQASADLAASLGIDLQSAARNVGKTVGGFAGELGEVIPELKDLSTESLQAGEGIAFLAEKFKGAAQKEAETFSGKVKQLQNALTDMAQAAGESVTQSEEVIESLDEMKDSVEDLTPQVAKLAEVLVLLTSGTLNTLVKFGELIVKWNQFLGTIDDVDDAMEDTAFATGVLEARAAALGISVEELRKRLTDAGQGAHVLEGGAHAAAEAVDEVATASENAAKAQAKLDAATRQSATAMEELGEALGIVTSAQLEAEILKINTALEKVRVTSGEWSPEFIRQQEVAEVKVESLRERIDSLKRGLGDLAEEEDAATESTDALGESMGELVTHTREMTTALSLNMTFLRNTAIAYDQLAKSIGEAAAQQAALESGMATLSQGGTRIRFAGGGSRLVNTDGRTYSGTSAYSLSTFGTGGRTAVDSDGSVRPV